MDALLRVSSLSATYGSQTRLQDVTFQVEPGEVVGVLGVNGAGKTTLFSRILGALPGRGEVEILGHTALAPHPGEVGVVWDRLGMHPGITVDALLRAWGRAMSLATSRQQEVLREVGLAGAGKRRVGQLSLGMRQRLALAMALAPDPRVLLLDEPANGLDPEGINWLNRILRDFAGSGGAVLLSSHQLSELERMVTRVLLIDAGKLISDQSLEAFNRSHSNDRHVLRCSRIDDLASAFTELGAQVEYDTKQTLVVSGLEHEQVVLTANKFGGVIDTLYEQACLGEAFVSFVEAARKEAA